MYKYKYVSTQNMNLRPAPNVNNSPIGSIPANTVGYGDELQTLTNGDKWLKVLQGGTVQGWVAVIHLGKVYGQLTEQLPDPDPNPTPTAPNSFTLINDETGEQTKYVKVQ